MNRFDYIIPKDLEEAISLVKGYGLEARYVAGGTDLLVRLKQRALRVNYLVSLRRIGELKGISRENGSVRIGGMTTFREILRSEIVQSHLPVLIEASKVLANPQVRNVATISGNICNAAPSADSLPPLMVLGATLTLRGPEGDRTIPLEDFFEGPGKTRKANDEVLLGLSVRMPDQETRFSFQKIGRVSQDIAIVNGAIAISLEKEEVRSVRLVLGAVAPVPLRLRGVEERLTGQRLTGHLLDEAQKMAEKEVQPISDVRASEEYRRHLSGVVVRRLIEKASGIEDL